MDIQKINLNQKFETFTDFWHPRLLGRLKGEFVWHQHEAEDEMFFVISGRLKIELEDKILELSEGELVIIPRGVMHRPVADEEVKVMLFEPAGTLNTGNVRDDLTRDVIKEI